MKNTKRLSVLLLCVLAVFSLAACQQSAKPQPEAVKLTQVSLAEVTHSVFYAPQYVAINLGFFEEEGLDVTLSTGKGPTR